MVVFAGVLINARMLWNVIHHPTRLLDDNYSVKAHNQYDAKWYNSRQNAQPWAGKQVAFCATSANDSMAIEGAARFI